VPVQDALAEFIDDGHFAAHIRKMTRIYRARRDRLIAALSAVAGRHLTIEPPAGVTVVKSPADIGTAVKSLL